MGEGREHENSVLSGQFLCKPKLALEKVLIEIINMEIFTSLPLGHFRPSSFTSITIDFQVNGINRGGENMR